MALDVVSSRSAAYDRARGPRFPEKPKTPTIIDKLFRPDPELARKRKEKREEYKLERRRLAVTKQGRSKKIFAQTRSYESKMNQRLGRHRDKPYEYLPRDVEKLLDQAGIKEKQWNEQSNEVKRKVRKHFTDTRNVALRQNDRQFRSEEKKLRKDLADKYGLAA